MEDIERSALIGAGIPLADFDPAEVEADIAAFMAAGERERRAERLAAGIIDVEPNKVTGRYEMPTPIAEPEEPEMERCSECEGEETVECSCGGDPECVDCEGHGEVDCPWCDGTGEEPQES